MNLHIIKPESISSERESDNRFLVAFETLLAPRNAHHIADAFLLAIYWLVRNDIGGTTGQVQGSPFDAISSRCNWRGLHAIPIDIDSFVDHDSCNRYRLRMGSGQKFGTENGGIDRP
jgi:hypothetical protein